MDSFSLSKPGVSVSGGKATDTPILYGFNYMQKEGRRNITLRLETKTTFKGNQHNFKTVENLTVTNSLPSCQELDAKWMYLHLKN